MNRRKEARVCTSSRFYHVPLINVPVAETIRKDCCNQTRRRSRSLSQENEEQPEDFPQAVGAMQPNKTNRHVQKHWHDTIGRPQPSGPTLTSLAYSDLAMAGTLLHVAARNFIRGSVGTDHLPNIEDRHLGAANASEPQHETETSPTSDPYAAAAQEDYRSDTASVYEAADMPLTPSGAALTATEQKALRVIYFLTHLGGGAWLWAALAAVDTPVVPETDIVLQQLLRRLCENLKVVLKLREDLFQNGASAVSDVGACLRPSQIGPENLTRMDVRGMQSLVVIVGKYFKQANPSVLPL